MSSNRYSQYCYILQLISITTQAISDITAGWGSTQDSSIGRNQLRGTELPIISEEKCNLAYKAHARITDRMICAGFDKGGKDGKFLHVKFFYVF